MAQVVESVIQQILEAQISEPLGADRYDWTDERGAYRERQSLYPRRHDYDNEAHRHKSALMVRRYIRRRGVWDDHAAHGSGL